MNGYSNTPSRNDAYSAPAPKPRKQKPKKGIIEKMMLSKRNQPK